MKVGLTATNIVFYPNQANAGFFSQTYGNKDFWYCTIMGYSSTEPAAYYINSETSTLPTITESITDYGAVADVTGRSITIKAFNGFIREIKLFS